MAALGRRRHFSTLCRQTLPDLLRQPPQIDPLRHDRGLSWAHVSAPPDLEKQSDPGTSPASQQASPGPVPMVTSPEAEVPPAPSLVIEPSPGTEPHPRPSASPNPTDSSPSSPSSVCSGDSDGSLGSPPPLIRASHPIVITPDCTNPNSIWTLSDALKLNTNVNSDDVFDGALTVKTEPLDTYSDKHGNWRSFSPMDCDDPPMDQDGMIKIKTEPGISDSTCTSVKVKQESQDDICTQPIAARPLTLSTGPVGTAGLVAPLCIDLRQLVPKVDPWSPTQDSKLSPPAVECPNPLLSGMGPSTIYSIGMALANLTESEKLPELKVEELEELELPECKPELQQFSLVQLQAASEQLREITRKLRPGAKAYGVIQNGTLTGILSDPNIAVADSNSPKQAFVPCKVCGDKASGYHYGVTSCEGCKGFFRRSIQKQIEYRCLRDGKCLVMRLNRNRCQYCRFKKCLAVGMSRDSVRYGRVPKRTKSQDEQRVSTSAEASQDQSVMESKQLAIYDIILAISHAHHANCILTEDKVKTLTKKTFSLVTKLESIESMHHSTSETVETHRIQMFQNLAAIITPSIQRVVEFAKRVPGFHDVSQDDQLVLIKSSFFEIWLTRMIRMFNHSDGSVMFGDGCIIPRAELEIIFTSELMTDMFSYSSNFCQLRLNDTEIGLFTGIVLATPDRSGLSDNKAVERIQDKLFEALKLQISRNHAMEPSLFASILMKLPELRSLGTKHNDLLGWFRERWNRLQLPPLLAEIYDIPKMEEDLHGLGAQHPPGPLHHHPQGGAGGGIHQQGPHNPQGPPNAGHPPPGHGMHNHQMGMAPMPGPQALPPIQVGPLQGPHMGPPPGEGLPHQPMA